MMRSDAPCARVMPADPSARLDLGSALPDFERNSPAAAATSGEDCPEPPRSRLARTPSLIPVNVESGAGD